MEKPAFAGEMRDAVLRTDFKSFIRKSFLTVNPATVYQPNWHIGLIADRLEMALSGGITRLIINVPPRSLKSLCVSVAWPAWILGHNPAARIMAASYSQALAVKHSLDCRLVVTSPWYRQLFPALSMSQVQNEKNKFSTGDCGYRFATSVGGTATGEGGNFLIVDDPHNPLQAASPRLRQHALRWFDQTFMSRLDDKQKGVVVVVMQRLHADDLTGHLLAKNSQWEHLCLPAIAVKETCYHFLGTTKQVQPGDILHASREDAEKLEQAKCELGSYAFAAQYQQDPIPAEGTLIKIEWVKRYTGTVASSSIYQSWDTAIKAASGNDYSVCTTWTEYNGNYYLLDVVRKKCEYPELKKTALASASRWKPDVILIEDKASGQSLLQDIKLETLLPVIAIRPSLDKVTRFAACSPFFEAGRVFLPEQAAWLLEYEAELFSFPAGKYDDQIDATSQFLNYMKQKRTGTIRIRAL